MQKITSSAKLKSAIQLLELEQAVNGQQLKEQLYFTKKSFMPFNLLKNSLGNTALSPSLIDNMIGTVVGLATGYLTKKIFIGTSGNILRKLFGSVLQFGVTNIIALHPDAIKSFGRFILQFVIRKIEQNSKHRDR